MCSTLHPSLLQQLYCRLPLLYIMSVCNITYHNDGMKTQTIFRANNNILTNAGPRVALNVSSTEQQQPQPITTVASLRGRQDLLLKMVCKHKSVKDL